MKFKKDCTNCGKSFNYTAKNLDVKNRIVKCPHCNDVQCTHPAWDTTIITCPECGAIVKNVTFDDSNIPIYTCEKCGY